MSNYDLQDYEKKLIKQVIHMDQGVAYSPEFRATKQMVNYPSRKMLIARALLKNEIPVSEHSAQILNFCILSRQGERWQNFGEDPEDFSDCIILARKLIFERGFNKDILADINNRVKNNNGLLYDLFHWNESIAKDCIPTSVNSNRYLLLDDMSCALIPDIVDSLGCLLKRENIKCFPDLAPKFLGWEYFAHGFVEAGKIHVRKFLSNLNEKNIKEIIVISGQAEYFLKIFLPKIGLNHGFKVISLLDIANKISVPDKSFVYAGSFITRYLMKSDLLNSLIKNNYEIPLPRSEEFIQIYDSDKRVNDINIWQKPLCAEFLDFCLDEDMAEKIFFDGYEDVLRSPHENLVVFEPYAFNLLKTKAPKENIIYFIDCLL